MPPRRRPSRADEDSPPIRTGPAVTQNLPSMPSRFDTSYGSAPSTMPRNSRRGQVRNIQVALEDALNDDDDSDDGGPRRARRPSVPPRPNRRQQPEPEQESESESEPEPEPGRQSEPDNEPDFDPGFDAASNSPASRHSSPPRQSPPRRGKPGHVDIPLSLVCIVPVSDLLLRQHQPHRSTLPNSSQLPIAEVATRGSCLLQLPSEALIFRRQ
ncbi:hypothetical protein CGCS363_v008717 [Colletotrichum siamense]|uniref:uncharacterized protein n=1 Tax=Colletotrichum siamense TaxID=690259 RepID=UPI0018724306|nr:uncharacterized protein CGCS363_v008717 [Colletotrichum siamense]KAF5497572.1 hypothetical protein CGCS363_v008717 [Colletotrichum siamense]